MKGFREFLEESGERVIYLFKIDDREEAILETENGYRIISGEGDRIKYNVLIESKTKEKFMDLIVSLYSNKFSYDFRKFSDLLSKLEHFSDKLLLDLAFRIADDYLSKKRKIKEDFRLLAIILCIWNLKEEFRKRILEYFAEYRKWRSKF